MSQWEVGLDINLVAGAKLNTAARRVLANAGPVYEQPDVRTSDYHLPPDFIRLDTLTIKEGTARVEALRGPVPVGATLACGTGMSVTLHREGQGWAFTDEHFTVC